MTSCTCVTRFKVAQHKFSQVGSVGPKQTNTKTCHVLVATWHQFQSLNHTFWNLKLKTYYPSKYVKFQWVAQHMFWCLDNSNPKTYCPPKHVNFREVCFDPMHPSSMFPHAIPIHAAWPIHDNLDFFQLSYTSSNFC
jgi:hypothetical protein